MQTSVTRTRSSVATLVLGLTSLVVQIPFLERGLSLYDEGSILAIADALRHGEVLYRDRATPLAPLTYELMHVLFDRFGPSILVGRVLQAIVFTLCVLLVHRILLHCTSPRWAMWGALAMLPVKALGFPFWTVVNYSQIAMLFCLTGVLAVIRFLEERRLLWLAVAGAAVGLVMITKQNLGVFLAATLAGSVMLDALRERGRAIKALAVRGSVLLAGAVLPLVAVVALYAARGALGDLVGRAVVGLLYLVQPYIVRLPWTFGSGDLGPVIFTYFPTPLAHLFWEGRINLFSAPLVLSIGYAVKATYFGPLIALLLGLGLIVWGLRDRLALAEWSRLVVVVAFGAMAYASMLYRADWTHLMNISPALLVLCVVVLWRLANANAMGVWLARAAVSMWLVAGSLAAVTVFAAYEAPIDTPRGRLFAPRAEAEDVHRVLQYLATQPAQAQILVLRAEPLYYFLAGRSIPGAFDLVMPGLLGPGDDEQISRSLAQTDQVIYNPKVFLTVASPLTEYAPQTAQALSTAFRVTDVIGPAAVVLQPIIRPPRDRILVDLWREAVGADESGRIERTSWMMYRVIAATVRDRGIRNCFTVSHVVGDQDVIAVTPMLNPVTWAQRRGDPDFNPELTGARFEISLASGAILYSGERWPGPPGNGIRIPLHPFSGQQVAIRFCTMVTPDAPPGPALAPAGWGEPRIVQALNP